MGLGLRFINGYLTVFRGLKLILKFPSLFKYIFFPFLIFVFSVAFLGYYSFLQVSDWSDMALFFIKESLPFLIDSFWIQILSWVLYFFILIPVLSLVMAFLYLSLSLVASPFHSLLAEKALEKLGLLDSSSFSFRESLLNSLKMIYFSFIRLILFLIFGIVLFILSFIPFLNIMVSYCLFVFIGFDCMDFSLEVKKKSLRERFVTLREWLPEYLGLGAFLWMISLIPGLLLVAIPFAVAGCADLLLRIKMGKEKKGEL